MTLILCYAEQNGIRILGDSGRNLGGGPPLAQAPPAPRKVQRSPRATIAGAIFGDWPINHNGNAHQPDLWFERFMTTEVALGSTVEQAVQSLMTSLQRATFVGFPAGGFILAGFSQERRVLYEIEGRRRNQTEQVIDFIPTVINEATFATNSLVRGLGFQAWGQVQAFCGCPALTPGHYQSAFLDAVQALSRMGQPVAEPVVDVFIEPTPPQRPNLQAPAAGSFSTNPAE